MPLRPSVRRRGARCAPRPGSAGARRLGGTGRGGPAARRANRRVRRGAAVDAGARIVAAGPFRPTPRLPSRTHVPVHRYPACAPSRRAPTLCRRRSATGRLTELAAPGRGDVARLRDARGSRARGPRRPRGRARTRTSPPPHTRPRPRRACPPPRRGPRAGPGLHLTPATLRRPGAPAPRRPGAPAPRRPGAPASYRPGTAAPASDVWATPSTAQGGSPPTVTPASRDAFSGGARGARPRD
jgi:hypothetical protein